MRSGFTENMVHYQNAHTPSWLTRNTWLPTIHAKIAYCPSPFEEIIFCRLCRVRHSSNVGSTAGTQPPKRNMHIITKQQALTGWMCIIESSYICRISFKKLLVVDSMAIFNWNCKRRLNQNKIYFIQAIKILYDWLLNANWMENKIPKRDLIPA